MIYAGRSLDKVRRIFDRTRKQRSRVRVDYPAAYAGG
jgi:hypothetical protein